MKSQFSFKSIHLILLIFIFLLILGISACSGKEPSDSAVICTVTIDDLEVYKKTSDSSRVLSRLPADLEIEIQEQKTVDGITWGRIDDMKLADGSKIKAGWILMDYVRFGNEPIPEETQPEQQDEDETPAITVNMGTVTAGKLNVRKGPDSEYETAGAYYNGDRIEILETKTVGKTVWGRTNLGWVGMGYVRMDGSEVTDKNASGGINIITNGNTQVVGYGVIDLGELNVRSGPGTDYDKVTTVKQGVRYAYYQLSTTSGSWARIEDGWVSTEFFYIEGASADDALTGTVNEDNLNIRSGPDTSFRSIGTYQKDETIEILTQIGNWGYTEKGWVFMKYVEPVAPTYTTGICKITRGLNIRQEPNADAEIIGGYSEGDGVNILEVQGDWGRTIQGWINLHYVEYEKTE